MFLPITSYPNIFRFLSIFGFPERLIKYDFAICCMISCLEIDPFNSMQGYNCFFNEIVAFMTTANQLKCCIEIASDLILGSVDSNY